MNVYLDGVGFFVGGPFSYSRVIAASGYDWPIAPTGDALTRSSVVSTWRKP
jgi:hypothetical protein